MHRSRRERLVYLYVVLMIGLCAISVMGFVRLIRVINQPFGGFIWDYDEVQDDKHTNVFYVSNDVPLDWAGPVAGLVPFTRIFRINGHIPTDFADVYATTHVGDQVTYCILRPGASVAERITAPIVQFTLSDFLRVYVPSFAVGISFVFAGLRLVQSAQTDGRMLLAFLCLAAGGLALQHTHTGFVTSWDMSEYQVVAALVWAPCLVALGVIGLHIACVYPQPCRRLRLTPVLVIWWYRVGGILALALAITTFFSTDLFVSRIQDRLVTITLVLIGVSTSLMIVHAIFSWRHGYLNPAERREFGVVVGALIASVLLFMLTIIAGILDWQLPIAFEDLVWSAIFLPMWLAHALINVDYIHALEERSTQLNEVTLLRDRDRHDLAANLHDGPLINSRGLQASVEYLDRLIHTPEPPVATIAEILAQTSLQSRALTTSLRGVAEFTKPEDFQAEGPSQILSRTISWLNLTTTASIVTRYRLVCCGPVDLVDPLINEQIFYIVREALSNVRAHAQASECVVSLTVAEGMFHIMVRDNGRGLSIHPVRAADDPPRRGLGLVSMRRRVAYLGGTLRIDSPHEGGTTVYATLPLPTEPYHAELTHAPGIDC
jgi:signal transduction histidine kinase